MDAQWEGIPSNWGIYFRVEDCDATAERVKELGGKVCHGPFDAPGVGRIAVLSDPQGAYFSVIKLTM
jgi:predicted enzyme related to lactoylglutathione lyase